MKTPKKKAWSHNPDDGRPLSFSSFIMSCEARRPVLNTTLAKLKLCGWPQEPELVLDDQLGDTNIDRCNNTWRRLIKRASVANSDFLLLFEDDLIFGRWFPENLHSWSLLRKLPSNGAFYGSLYNPGRPLLSRHDEDRYLIADPNFMWGAQALVMTPLTARFIDEHWDEVPTGNADTRMPALAARLAPIYLHAPSLVEHAPVPTTWGGIKHQAVDFDPDWKPTGSR